MKFTEQKPEFKKFKVFLSSGSPIQIDEDEVDKVLLGVRTGQVVKVRQGIFNPSFFVCIGFDIKRYEEWKAMIETKGFQGEEKRLYPVIEKLPDIFEDIKKLT